MKPKDITIKEEKQGKSKLNVSSNKLRKVKSYYIIK